MVITWKEYEWTQIFLGEIGTRRIFEIYQARKLDSWPNPRVGEEGVGLWFIHLHDTRIPLQEKGFKTYTAAMTRCVGLANKYF